MNTKIILLKLFFCSILPILTLLIVNFFIKRHFNKKINLNKRNIINRKNSIDGNTHCNIKNFNRKKYKLKNPNRKKIKNLNSK
ncbi:hypothetical protein [Borreliella garinii]|uniref:hypothetical protein n=1 Tax=Borreliella garinii TaxID=29519 RepID=UPI001AEFB525|nr:hypothetical protein [Borreliella garinii]